MFSVGDKIVYPMHGAGVVEKIKVENVFGRRSEILYFEYSVRRYESYGSCGYEQQGRDQKYDRDRKSVV